MGHRPTLSHYSLIFMDLQMLQTWHVTLQLANVMPKHQIITSCQVTGLSGLVTAPPYCSKCPESIVPLENSSYLCILSLFVCLSVVILSGEAEHRKFVQPGLVCRWHSAGGSLWKWTRPVCSCRGAAMGVEEFWNHTHKETHDAGTHSVISVSHVAVIEEQRCFSHQTC